VRSAGVTADAAERAASMPFAIQRPPITALTLTADKAPPQVPGTTINVTATPTGGVAAHQYKWLLFNGTAWSTLQDWGVGNVLAWTPADENPNYRIGVWVRSAGNTADAAERAQSMLFPIVRPRLSALALSADRVAPQAPGTTTTFTATPTGGVGPYQYKWLVFDPAAPAAWLVRQDWSVSNTFAWTPTVRNTGYRVGVWARSAGDTVDGAEAAASVAFAIIPSTLTGVNVLSDKLTPQAVNTTINLTATLTGGVAGYEFKFLVFDGVAWSTLRDWGASTATWTPTVANPNYRVGLWVRNAGSAEDLPNPGGAASIAFVITP
jgi:hypothetical protein